MLILRRRSCLPCEAVSTQAKSQSLPKPKQKKFELETSILTAPQGKSIMHCRRPLVNLKKPTKRCCRTPKNSGNRKKGDSRGSRVLRCGVLNGGEVDRTGHVRSRGRDETTLMIVETMGLVVWSCCSNSWANQAEHSDQLGKAKRALLELARSAELARLTAGCFGPCLGRFLALVATADASDVFEHVAELALLALVGSFR